MSPETPYRRSPDSNALCFGLVQSHSLANHAAPVYAHSLEHPYLNVTRSCRKCYVHPEVLTSYLDGNLVLEIKSAVERLCADTGNLVVDDHQRTTVPGLYAAGDVVTDLHQLSVAFGHAAVAATSIHNQLPANYY
jgi:hypothetical protein